MGFSSGRKTKMMTVLSIACLAAVAVAESDLLYTGNIGIGYGGYFDNGGGYGNGKREADAGVDAGYYRDGLGYGNGYYGKREAEPNAEADPDLLYGGYYGHGLAYGNGYYGKREAEPNAKARPRGKVKGRGRKANPRGTKGRPRGTKARPTVKAKGRGRKAIPGGRKARPRGKRQDQEKGINSTLWNSI